MDQNQSRSRLEFQAILESIVDTGSKVYFQPPATLKMSYPCIRYSLERMDGETASNDLYMLNKAYNVIYISTNPDSTVPEHLRKLPNCRFNRAYSADNLHHWVFTIYY